MHDGREKGILVEDCNRGCDALWRRNERRFPPKKGIGYSRSGYFSIRSGLITIGLRFQRFAMEFHRKPVITPSR